MTQYWTLAESCFAYGTRGQNPIERMNHRVIWSFGTLAKFIRHRTTAIRQLTFESRDRPYYKLWSIARIFRNHSTRLAAEHQQREGSWIVLERSAPRHGI